MNAGDMLEAVRPWISTVSLVAILGLVVRWRLGMRKLDIENRTADITGEKALRDHYAQEVSELRRRLDEQSRRYNDREREIDAKWREALAKSDERHSICEREREELKEEIRKLKITVEGMRFNIIQAADSALYLQGREPSDDVVEAAERVIEHARQRRASA